MLQLMATFHTLGCKTGEAVKARRKNDRGQTAAEYLGIIVVIAAIVGVLAGSNIGTTLVNAINTEIGKVLAGAGK
jgi:pilus assembly protein Flp/PilA